MAFISLTVGNFTVVHGYDEHNREIVENVVVETPVAKLVAISRIQSVSEKYVLVTGSHGRLMYWEYTDGYEAVQDKLRHAGLLI